MSEENVEVVTRAIAAFNRGDLDAALKDAAPDFELDNSRDVGEWRGVHTTPDQVRRMWESFVAPWESFRIEIDEFIEACEDVVVTRQTGYLRGRDGIEVTARTNWVWTIRDGAIRKLVSYNELDEALEAAGLLE